MPYASDRQRGFMHAQHPGIAARWDAEQHNRKRRRDGSSSVGKRASGGSFESGPSTIVRGVSRGVRRRNSVSSSFGGTPGHGRRYGPESGLEHYAGRSSVAKFDPTSVLSRTGKLGQVVQTGMQTARTGAKTLGEGIRAGQMGSAPMASPVGGGPNGTGGALGRSGKVLLGTGQKLGQATSSPMRAAATGGAIGAAGTAATATAMGGQKDPNQNVGKADYQNWQDEMPGGGTPHHVRQHQARQAANAQRETAREQKRADRKNMVTPMRGSRPRNYDPEAHRQRRIGSAQGVANTAGAASLAAGAHEYRKLNLTRRKLGQGERVLNRSAAGRIGGGALALAAGEKIRRHGNDPRNRAWR
jgi:hypothetical protein